MGKYDLHDAADAGDLMKVQSLLDMFPDTVNARGPKNRTPLHCAAKGDRPEVALYLLSMGADPEARTAYKMTPLHVASFYGSAKVIDLLLKEVKGLQIDALDFGSWTALHYACNYNWGGCAALLIDAGANLMQRSAELQFIALHLAARSGNVPTVRKLVERGCDVNFGNLFYTTSLHLACQNDHLEMVKLLLEKGAEPEAPDEAGITPLQLSKRDDIMETLQQAIASKSMRKRQPPPPAS